MTYDPIPDLAALIDGLRGAAGDGDNVLTHIAVLLTGPYARLCGGLLLDGLDSEGTLLNTEAAIRSALAELKSAQNRRDLTLEDSYTGLDDGPPPDLPPVTGQLRHAGVELAMEH